VIALALAASTAWAGPADVAFDKGRTLLKAGKYAEAKVAFEESQRLDPKNGTRFNIAQCDEHLGKLASALAVYRDLAANDTKPERKALSADLVRQLELRVPKLQIQLEPRVPGAAITLNGALACAAPCDPAAGVPVDFGSYTVGATAEGHEPGSATATVNEEGRTVVVAIRVVAKASRAVITPVAVPPDPGASRRR
jgi:hypothetical protein